MTSDTAPRNPLEEIEHILGGPMEVSRASGLTYARIYQIREKEGGTMKNARAAKALDEATAAKGHRVPMLEILGLEPWRGLERFDGGPPKGGRPDESPGASTEARGASAPDAPATPRLSLVSALSRPGRFVGSKIRCYVQRRFTARRDLAAAA